ncbi:DUF2147 domain-containing protein [Shimia biformata]|uniref:DUF2147 domain-containing protein n=1 Tax=Shimia biformata TaxID=1294299 RepID=UPI0019524CAB|nr:DUF2147 domain-containing protein [Shimia biformata]
MKKLVLAAAGLILSAGVSMADPALGIWKTEVDDGSYAHVEMRQCGAKICGKMIRTFDANGEYKSKNIGKDLVLGMSPEGNGHYKGEVWRPSNDKIYVGKMDVSGDKLKLKGCVAGGLLCSSQNWTRVK